jgi:hypothetical protein
LSAFELIADLRERIWAQYDLAIAQRLCEQRCTRTEPLPNDATTDWPF